MIFVTIVIRKGWHCQLATKWNEVWIDIQFLYLHDEAWQGIYVREVNWDIIGFSQGLVTCWAPNLQWLTVRGIYRSLVKFPLKGQWYGALMFSLICACINGWVYKREAGDLGRRSTHYDVTVMASGAWGNKWSWKHKWNSSFLYTENAL